MSKNFELLQKIGKEQVLFTTPGDIPVAVRAVEYEQPEAVDVASPAPEMQKPEPQKTEVKRREVKEAGHAIRWQDSIKEKVRPRKQRLHSRGTARATEIEAITRREEFKLVQRIFPLGNQRATQVVAFSGVEGGQAAPVIVARSAEVLAARGEGFVCVVDANLESPILHRYFQLSNETGLSDAIAGRAPVQDFIQQVPETNLWVMPSGMSGIGLDTRGSLEGLNARITELRGLFKYVLIHCPLNLEQASIVSNLATDGVVLVVEANSTRREQVREAMRELEMMRTRVLGVVLNNRTFPIPEAIYHKL